MPKTIQPERQIDKIEPRELLPMARVVLTPKRFEAWYSVHIDGYTIQETGATLLIATSTVYYRLHRATDDLEGALQEEKREKIAGRGFALIVYEQNGEVQNYEDEIVKEVVKRYDRWQMRQKIRAENKQGL